MNETLTLSEKNNYVRDLIDEHGSKLFNFIKSYGWTHEESQDIWQEAFIRLSNAMGRMNLNGNIGGWLRVTALNFMKDYCRRKRVRIKEVHGYDFSRARGRNGMLNQREYRELCNRVIELLPETFQGIIRHRLDNGKEPYKKVARELDIPIGTVRSKLSRARGILKEKLPEILRN